MSRLLLWLMFTVAVATWTVVGFFLWIPLLLRTTTVFSAMVIHATITGQKPDALRGHLQTATSFYLDGFRIAYGVVNNPVPDQPQPLQIHLDRVLAECLWATMLWIVLLAAFHPAVFASLGRTVSDAVEAIGKKMERLR